MAKSFIPLNIRIEVAKRANWNCEYCRSQERFAPQHFTIDHIIPVSKEGNNEFDNLAYACQGCNGSKFDKIAALDSLTKETVPLFNPRIQKWEEHFAWNDLFTNIIGTTQTGRSTVVSLKLNRKQLVELREVLVFFGEHPVSLIT